MRHVIPASAARRAGAIRTSTIFWSNAHNHDTHTLVLRRCESMGVLDFAWSRSSSAHKIHQYLARQRWIGSSNLQFTLVRPLAAYVGTYESPEWGHVEIVEADRTLLVTCGVLRAVAEPFGKPDTVWLELEPGEGGVLQFEGSGTAPDSLCFDGRRFHRITTPAGA